MAIIAARLSAAVILSGGDGVAMGIVSLFTHLRESLRRQLGVKQI